MVYNIIFKRFFVEAILSGAKTQTRRVEKQYVKPGDHLLARTAYFEKPFARLKVKAVEQQKLQEISLMETVSEGFQSRLGEDMLQRSKRAYSWFGELWNSINTKKGHRWEDNPEVTVIEFEVMR